MGFVIGLVRRIVLYRSTWPMMYTAGQPGTYAVYAVSVVQIIFVGTKWYTLATGWKTWSVPPSSFDRKNLWCYNF